QPLSGASCPSSPLSSSAWLWLSWPLSSPFSQASWSSWRLSLGPPSWEQLSPRAVPRLLRRALLPQSAALPLLPRLPALRPVLHRLPTGTALRRRQTDLSRNPCSPPHGEPAYPLFLARCTSRTWLATPSLRFVIPLQRPCQAFLTQMRPGLP